MTQASDCFEADPVQDARPDQPETRFPWDHQVFIINIINIINFINIIITTIIVLTTLTSRDVASEMKLLLDAAGRLAPMLPEQVSALPSPLLPPSSSTSLSTATTLATTLLMIFRWSATSRAGPGSKKAFGDKSQFQQRTQRIFQRATVSDSWGWGTFTWMYLIYLHFTYRDTYLYFQ